MLEKNIYSNEKIQLHVKHQRIPIFGDQWRKIKKETKKELSDMKKENSLSIMRWEPKHDTST